MQAMPFPARRPHRNSDFPLTPGRLICIKIHADIKTTTRYAHVLDSEVAEAMESLTKSRNKS
jgi:hypothetical protein